MITRARDMRYIEIQYYGVTSTTQLLPITDWQASRVSFDNTADADL
jgi:hypothetical protein